MQPWDPLSKTPRISVGFDRAVHVPWVWSGVLNLLPKPQGSSGDTMSSHRFAGLCQRWEISSFLVSALIPKVRNGSISAPISRHMNNKANGFWSSAKMPALCVEGETSWSAGLWLLRSLSESKGDKCSVTSAIRARSCQNFLAATCEAASVNANAGWRD